MALLNTDMMATLVAADQPKRENFFKTMSDLMKVDVETLRKEFEEGKAKQAEKLERARKRQERERRNARIRELNEEAENLGPRSSKLGDFISRVEAEEGRVVLTTDDNGRLVIRTTLAERATRGGTSGGKPAADAPQPYVDADGERIYGPLTVWAKDNLSEEELQEAGCYRPNGKFRTGAQLARKLTEAGFISEEAVTPEEAEEAAEEAEEEAEAAA